MHSHFNSTCWTFLIFLIMKMDIFNWWIIMMITIRTLATTEIFVATYIEHIFIIIMFVIPNVNVCIDFVTIHYKYTIIVNHYHPLYKHVILPITINKPCQFSFLMFLIHKYCQVISLSPFPSISIRPWSFNHSLSSQGQLNRQCEPWSSIFRSFSASTSSIRVPPMEFPPVIPGTGT